MSSKYIIEFKHLIKIGLPIFGSQMSYMLMSATDTIIAGNASSSDQAGLAVGTAILNTVWFLIAGVVFSVTPIVAQLYGAKKFIEIGHKLREVLWIAFFLGFFLALLFFNLEAILRIFPAEDSLSIISINYLKAVSPGILFLTLFTCLRCYSEGMTLTKPIFVIAFTGMIINIPLDLIFVYGWFGIPKLGGVGCGIATSIVTFLMMLILFFYISKSKKYEKTKPFLKFTFTSFSTVKEVFKLGLPIGIGIFFELSMFSGSVIILKILFDEIVVASHAVAINIAALFFMVPLSIGLAAATRVGNLIGENRPKDAKTASYSTVYFCIIAAIINILIILIFGSNIISFYSNELPVINLAISLIIFAAIFQLPDGIQMGALGSLRGYKDTFIPMILLFISYWVFAMPIGYYLTITGFNEPMGVYGMWIGMIIGLSIFSFLSIGRMKWIIQKNIKTSEQEPLLL